MLTNVAAKPDTGVLPRQSYPMVQVRDAAALDRLRAFYLQTLGCPATFDMEAYLQVQLTPNGTEGPELAFMITPGAPEQAQGFLLSVPVGDVDALQTRLEGASVVITERAADRPWGWRSLHIVDPAGVILDFFHVLGEDPADAKS